MSKDFELILNDFVLALQICLGVWQFTKLTPVGALIQGVVSWLLRPFGLSETYSTLQELDGRVFKKASCFVLQPEIPSARRPSARRGAVELGSEELKVTYLGKEVVLQRSRSDRNMLLVGGKMCYYIIPAVWEELQVLENVTNATADVGAAVAIFTRDAGVDHVTTAAYAVDPAIVDAALLAGDFAVPNIATALAAGGDAAAEALAAFAGALAAAGRRRTGSVVLKGHKEFWEEVSTGGIMSLDEVLDGLILHNQHLSLGLPDNRLLPVDLSVSEEKLLKILNLFAVFLKTEEEKVHWLIPTSLSFISAILEFSTPLRVCLYTNINVLFCSTMHSICDLLLPRPWRRQVYSLGKWVENLKPTNDILLKIQRGNIRVIIAGVAKIHIEGASLVPWLDVPIQEHGRYVKEFPCNSIDIVMTCTYFVSLDRCKIDAPTVSVFTVECRSREEYQKIITLVSRMAEHGCGSLKSYGPHNKVSVRGFRESVLCYVKSGFPNVYELELENAVLT